MGKKPNMTIQSSLILNYFADVVYATHSPKGRTPLSCAAEAGNDDIVGFLLTCRQTMSDGSVLTTSPEGSGVSEVSDGWGE